GGGGRPLKAAADGFVDGFAGTPALMTVVGFDKQAYVMYPPSHNYISLLDPAAGGPIKSRISLLDNLDGRWGRVPLDPNGDGIHWEQKGIGTNWEDGLYLAIHTTAGATLPPEQV